MNNDEKLFRFIGKTNLKYICLDAETESLSGYFSRPWQISWLVVENERVVEEFDLFPLISDLKVSQGAAAVTGFNFEEYKSKATDALEVCNKLDQYLYNEEYKIVGQNLLGFDVYQLRNFRRYCGKKEDYSFIHRIYDTMSIGKAIQLGIPFPTEQEDITPWMYRLINYRKKGLKSNLEFQCKMLDIPYNKELAHQANFDIKMTMEIFKKQYQKLEMF